MTEYVQAWEIKGDKFSGYVYNQAIALDKNALNANGSMQSVTNVRHDDGSKEYLHGTIAEQVKHYRKGSAL
jgi:hypothetical protein